MSRQYAVVNVATYTFDMWVSRTNDIVNLVNTDVVTVGSNSSGDFTYGNGTIVGTFGANTLFATELRGGNVTTSDVITVTSDLVVNGSQINSTANAYFAGANLYLETTDAISLIGNTAIKANSSFNIIDVVANATNQSLQVNVNSGAVVSGNVTIDNNLLVSQTITGSSTLSVNGAATLANTLTVTGYANLLSSANVGGTLRVAGATQLQSTLDVTAAATLQSSISVNGNTVLSNTLAVTGNSSFANTLAVTGAATFGNNVSIAGNTTLTNIFSGNSTVNTIMTSNSFQTNTITVFNLYVTGSVYGSLVANGSIIPNVNATFTLGTSTNTYSDVWSVNYYGNSYTISNTSVATTGSYTFTGTGQAVIDTFNSTDYRSAEYTLQFSDTASASYHITKIIVYHDNSNAYSAEYAQLHNNQSLATVTCDFNSGNVRVLVTPSVSTVVAKFTKNLLAV